MDIDEGRPDPARPDTASSAPTRPDPRTNPSSRQLIPLCVPYEARKVPGPAGGVWDPGQKQWFVTRERLVENFEAFRPFTPRMYRPDRQAPFIRPFMIPSSSWGKNLRAVLKRPEWDVVRKAAYMRSGYCCVVCGGRGPTYPVEADEAWSYDMGTGNQTLATVASLCPDCHSIRHWGKTQLDGREKEITRHLAFVNGTSPHETARLIDEGISTWHRRNAMKWTVDYSWVTRKYGFVPSSEGFVRARQENQKFRDMAREAAETVFRVNRM